MGDRLLVTESSRKGCHRISTALALSGVEAPEDQVFSQCAFCFRDGGVPLKFLGVDNRIPQTSLDAVVQEYRVQHLASCCWQTE